MSMSSIQRYTLRLSSVTHGVRMNRISIPSGGTARLMSSRSTRSIGLCKGVPPHSSTLGSIPSDRTCEVLRESALTPYGSRNSYSTALAIGRPTRVLLIPPQLARLLATVGLVMLDAVYVAYQKESKRLRDEEGSEKGAGSTGSTDSARDVKMRGEEALQVLGMNPGLQVPLKKQKDIDEATKKFNSLFITAQKCDNVFLQGKFSAAFRVCVDPHWDAHLSSDSENSSIPEDGAKTSSSSGPSSSSSSSS